jgi:hypothetical protein
MNHGESGVAANAIELIRGLPSRARSRALPSMDETLNVA